MEQTMLQELNKILIAKEKTLVIGKGEIGSSLGQVLSSVYDVSYQDFEQDIQGHFKVINICIPYSDNFLDIVRTYTARFKPSLVIIHSTVPPGTTKKLGKGFVHSPVNGKHPNLAQSIRTFVKFVGANSGQDTYEAVNYLTKAGMRCFSFSSSTATELAKILCTTYYGWSIMLMKEIDRLAQEYQVPFHEIYTEWQAAYNEGYDALGEKRFLRPNLFPMKGEIGGHCVINNCDLLDDFLTEVLKGRNNFYKGVENDLPTGVKQHSGEDTGVLHRSFTHLDRQGSNHRRKGKNSGIRVRSGRSNH